jgi:hypothetical protein
MRGIRNGMLNHDLPQFSPRYIPQPAGEQINESLRVLLGYPMHAIRNQLECDVLGELLHHIVSELDGDVGQ